MGRCEYRPLRRAIYHRDHRAHGLFWSKRRSGTPGDASAFGLCASGEYQIGRRWFAGARYDWSERADQSVTEGQIGVGDFDILAERVQSNPCSVSMHESYAEGVTANELLFQFLFSIGARRSRVLRMWLLLRWKQALFPRLERSRVHG